MFTATDFTYDNVFSGIYGLKIASFDSSVVTETTYVTPSINFVKPAKSKKFYFMDSKYDETPTFEFSIVCESHIPEIMQREILLWLDNRRGFKPLIIHQPDLNEYVYQCIFNVTSIIYHAGSCVGFNLQAIFDSPYHYKETILHNLTGTGSSQELIVYNNSDIIDDYIYPSVTFTPKNYFDETCSISIVNKTDDPAGTREFKFVGTALNGTVSVDNELKIIRADMGKDLLSKFIGKKWLRLVKGKNILNVKLNGQFSISFPTYAKIRF